MGPTFKLVIPTATVEVAGGESFTVRGLSPNDALQLYYRHAGQLSALFDQFAGKVKAKEAVAESDVVQAGVAMVSGAPLIMAEIIAIGMGAKPDDIEGFAEIVTNLLDAPAGLQMDALQKIGGLTFSSDMPPGKFFGLVLAMAQSATAALNSPRA